MQKKKKKRNEIGSVIGHIITIYLHTKSPFTTNVPAVRI